MNKETNNHRFPFIKNDRYYNSADDHPESFLFQTIPSFISSLYGRKKRQPENKSEWIALEPPLEQSKEPVITWIGHASFLIQGAGVNILTDPIFGPASAFFPRILPPGIAREHLPRIDYVIVSHNHRDHCDLASLQALKKTNPNMVLLVPKGDKQWLENKGLGPAVEHTWWQSYTHEAHEGPVTFTFLPAHHWSAQGVFDRNKSLWGSWMISFDGNDAKNIYFAGDTSYSDHFNHIVQEFSGISTALMPIAPEKPHPWMRKSHMDAQEAVQAFIDLKAHHFIPMHWGTFQFGLDTFHGPIERLKTEWDHHQLHDRKKLTISKVGQRIII
jgi:L-ascorbate metabolism protein UlaG (beta-lactamase superfamily)